MNNMAQETKLGDNGVGIYQYIVESFLCILKNYFFSSRFYSDDNYDSARSIFWSYFDLHCNLHFNGSLGPYCWWQRVKYYASPLYYFSFIWSSSLECIEKKLYQISYQHFNINSGVDGEGERADIGLICDTDFDMYCPIFLYIWT